LSENTLFPPNSLWGKVESAIRSHPVVKSVQAYLSQQLGQAQQAAEEDQVIFSKTKRTESPQVLQLPPTAPGKIVYHHSLDNLGYGRSEPHISFLGNGEISTDRAKSLRANGLYRIYEPRSGANAVVSHDAPVNKLFYSRTTPAP